MREINKKYVFAFVAVAILLLFSCTGGKHLRTEPMKGSESVKGTITLILYGARHLDDLETVAILDLEGDSYEFMPYAPEYDYKAIKGLSVKEAFQKAENFISFHEAFWISDISRIIDKEGETIGYELIPSYEFTQISPVVNYWYEEEGIVKFNVRLMPFIKNWFINR